MDPYGSLVEAACHIRGKSGSNEGYMETGNSSKRPPNVFVDAETDGSNETLIFHRQWKLPCVSMEASTNFQGDKPASINFHGSKSTLLTATNVAMDVSLLP